MKRKRLQRNKKAFKMEKGREKRKIRAHHHTIWPKSKRKYIKGMNAINLIMQRSLLEIKKKITPILEKHRIKRAGIFGSTARGEAVRGSDVDLLVALPKKTFSLFGFVALKQELEKRLAKKVDLVEYSTIKPRLRKSILENEVRVI
jgi:hypothetical protein